MLLAEIAEELLRHLRFLREGGAEFGREGRFFAGEHLPYLGFVQRVFLGENRCIGRLPLEEPPLDYLPRREWLLPPARLICHQDLRVKRWADDTTPSTTALPFSLSYNQCVLYAPRPPRDRKDFETHLKYVSLIARLAQGLSVSCSVSPTLPKEKLPQIADKRKLIVLTRQSIKDEYGIVQIDAEYSTASVLWLPIKAYYLAYHLLCLIDYMLTGKATVLRAKHGECVDRFTSMLVDGSLQFSEPLFNQVFDKSILNFKTQSGEHLRFNVSDDVLFKLAMKKIALEKIETFKTMGGITETRTKKNRDRVEKYKQTLSVSVFDFFYQMRLRMNYRNSDFIDDIPAAQIKTYFEQYCRAADRFYTAFSGFANKLIASISGVAF